MAANTTPQDGFARLAEYVAENSARDALRQDPAGTFGTANGWSAELVDWQGEAALSGIVLHRAGSYLGPFSDEAARRALAEGVLRKDDTAWDSAGRTWTTLGRLLGLDAAPAAPHPANTTHAMASGDILIYRNEQESVAYTPTEALAAVSRGELRTDDWAWNESIKDWVPLRTMLALPSEPPPHSNAPAAGAQPGIASSETQPPFPIAAGNGGRQAPGLLPADATMDEARRIVTGISDDKELLEKKVAGLEKHLAQALKACASLDRLKDELASAQQQIKDRQAEIETRGREASSWQVKAAEAEATLAGLREESTELRARAAAAQRAYADLETRLQGVSKFQGEIERLQRELAQARKAAETATAEANTAREEHQRLRGLMEKTANDLAAKDKRISQLEIQAAQGEALARRVAESSVLLDKARATLLGDK